MADTVEITFAGERLWLDPARALWWPAQDMLIVSDLHLGKGAFLRRHGSALPALDTHDTLLRLGQLIEQYRPQHLVCLGDSFHDRAAYQAMAAADRTQLSHLMARVLQWHWVLGNHDPVIERDLPGAFHNTLNIESLLLTHEPVQSAMPQIIGHFHPKHMMRLGGRSVSGPCFMISQALIIMPAFGSYTGGLDCADPMITSLMPGGAESHFIYNGKLWKA